MSERSPARRVGEWIADNKAESAWLALGAAALAYEIAAPDRTTDLLSHAADRHPVITALGTVVLGAHLCNVYERIGLEDLDVVSQIGKRFTRKVGESL